MVQETPRSCMLLAFGNQVAGGGRLQQGRKRARAPVQAGHVRRLRHACAQLSRQVRRRALCPPECQCLAPSNVERPSACCCECF